MKKIIDQIVTRLLLRIIIHCSATPEGKNFTVKDINTWHIARGWKSIGYHFVILLDGTIEVGRPLDQIGAHTLGFNKDSIGICYIGGVAADGKTPKDTRTPEQRTALITLVKELKVQYPNATIHGHNEFAPKACPSFIVKDELHTFAA